MNRYFTVTEYPVIAKRRGHDYRTATDLDVLAFRFPGAGRLVPGMLAHSDEYRTAVDDAIGIDVEQPDMLIGEVKEGRAVVNEAATDPGTLRAVLTAFGCCPAASAPTIVDTLIRTGRAALPNGHVVRIAVFASVTHESDPRCVTISLAQVFRFLRHYIDDHWDVLRHAESKDPAFGFLMTLAKAERGST